ncbi:MAG: DNA-directed RNA polymerase, subunit E'' [Desulfurococcales archaeon]|nr:DNA-directed RNA polymerase, subunit E'' [Desulfurococcales archaeon]
MASRRAARPREVACRKCGAIVEYGTKVCPVCGSTQFSESWEGMIIVVKEYSRIAAELGIEKPGVYAIKVAGRVITR